MHGLAIKFLDWHEKNKKYKVIKNCLIYIQTKISAYLNTCIQSFKKVLKTVGKGLQRNSVQFSHHVFLNVFSILKPLSFEGNAYLRKRKVGLS
jgi:hypothetical protein